MKHSEVQAQLEMIELKPGMRFSVATLKEILPDVETALFFAKAFGLPHNILSRLLGSVFNESSVIVALTSEGATHSNELQDYLLELGYDTLIESGDIAFDAGVVPQGEILPELWRDLQVDVAKSIKDVADKLKDVVSHMPGKQGEMLLKSMMSVNARRPVIGDYRAYVHHAPAAPNLVILDVSGSMTEETVRVIVDDVVALSYMADAHLAIVSNTTMHWQPGEFSVASVLSVAEYAGTHYETLAPLFQNQDWGVVVTIADYDSSWSAASAFQQCNGSIEQVLDISLVNRPTYLAEVVGLLAKNVRPLLVGQDNYSCLRY